jgi:hypothetical protein
VLLLLLLLLLLLFKSFKVFTSRFEEVQRLNDSKVPSFPATSKSAQSSQAALPHKQA